MRFVPLLFLLLAAPLWAGEPLRIAVASNFKPTLEKINPLFESESGITVVLSSASTGTLASQITYGAPFDIFFSADQETPAKLAGLGLGGSSGVFCYARGSLVLTGGGGSLNALSDPNNSLAIANPATAPYGRAAMEILRRAEFRSGEQRTLVRGNNVIQAFQFWYSGAVDLALLPRSIATRPYAPIPQTWHQSLEQHALLLKPGNRAHAYLNWIRSDNVRALITAAGYEPCP